MARWRVFTFIFCATLVLAACHATPARAELQVECDYDVELLPYEFILERRAFYDKDDPVNNPLVLIRSAKSPDDTAIAVAAYNAGGPRKDPAIVGTRNLSDNVAIDDNPLRGRIQEIQKYTDAGLGRDAVAVLFRRGDSIFVARYVPFRDGFDTMFLLTRSEATIGTWFPSLTIPEVTDYDFDGTDEAFIHVNPGRGAVPNRLFCVDLSTMTIEWYLDLAGGIGQHEVLSCNDSLNPSVIISTYNPKHGIRSKDFSDMFGHLARVNHRGEVEFNYLLSWEHGGVQLSSHLNDSSFIVSHSLLRYDHTDTLDLEPALNRLSIMTVHGDTIYSVPLPAMCRQTWIDDFDGDGNRNVYALLGDGELRVYDTTLRIIDTTGPTCLNRFVGRISLPGLNEPAILFLVEGRTLVYNNEFSVISELPALQRLEVFAYLADGTPQRYLGSPGSAAQLFRVRELGFWARLHHWFLKNEQYVLVGIVGLLLILVVSLFAHQRAAEKLRVQERRAAATIMSTPDLIIRVDRDGTNLDVHAHDPQMIPVPADQMIGMNARDLLPNDLYEYLMQAVDDVLDTGEVKSVEYEFTPRDVTRRYRANIAPAGKNEIVATMRDITVEFEAQKELRRSEARFRSLIEKSPAAVMLHIGDKIMFANQALADLTGYSMDELLKTTPAELCCPEYREAIYQRIKARRQGFDFDQMFEVEALTKQGERKWVVYRAGVISLDQQEVIMVIIHDISDRKEAEAQLAQATRQRFDQIRQVAGGLSHELYNSLYPVRTSIEQLSRLLKSGEQLDIDRVDRLLTLSESAINRAVSLTELVSRYSKIDQPGESEAVSLAQIVDEIRQQHEATLKQEDINLTVDLSRGLFVEGSSDHLYSLLNNLFINAIDAVRGRDERCIKIAAAGSDGTVEIRVSDTGKGISESDRERIFDPFYSTKPRTGTGLGLAVAQRIVDIWGGDITVESTIDKGTTFYVYLRSNTG